MPSKEVKEAADRFAESVASDPHTYELADFIADLIGLRTEFDRAENRACTIVEVIGRGLGSRQAAAEHMTVPGNWRRVLQISSELDGGAALPWSPPTENRVRQWRRRLLPDRTRADYKVVPETLRRIQAKVMELGIHCAVELGQFPEGVDPDFAVPGRLHQLIGDGTWVKEFSQAKVLEDPELGEMTSGTRAKKGKVRQQQAAQTLTKHDKKVSGVLHTVMITETPAGWVYLGGDQTFGGESDSSLDLVEQITAILGDRLHTLCYDRGFTGWPENWLMARHGIPVLTVANPRRSEKKDPELKQHRLDASKALAGLLPPRDARRPTLLAVRSQRALQAAADVEQMIEHRELGLPAGIGRPLGTCYYLTTGDNVEKVISHYYKYDTLRHDRADGTECEHHLYVDDGALWEAVQDGKDWIKGQRPRCSTARRVLDVSTGAWTLVMDWELECAETGQVLCERAVWEPELRREKADKHRQRSSKERALEAMQPLPRCDAAFSAAYGRRNEVESWFSWYKGTLRKGDSAASLSLDHQLLDLLMAGMVTNSRALRRARLAGLITPTTQTARSAISTSTTPSARPAPRSPSLNASPRRPSYLPQTS